MEVKQGAHRHSSKLWQLDAEMVSAVPGEGAWQGRSCCLVCLLTLEVKVKVAQLFSTPWTVPGNSQGQKTGVGSLSLLHRIFPTQELNPGLLHYRRIPYQLSHKGSPRILEWVVYPCFSGSSQSRNQTRVSCIAGRFFTKLSYQGSPLTIWGLLLLSRFSHVRLCAIP